MISLLKKEHIKEAANFIYQLNKEEIFYSGFCSGSLSTIEQDLKEAVKERKSFVYILNKKLVGVIMLVRSPNGEVDVIGPYVKQGDLKIAKKLLSKALENNISETTVHFFFSKSSTYYLSLMDNIGAIFHEIEYIMKCHEYVDANLEDKGQLVSASIEDKSFVQKLYEDIFPDTYLPSEKVIEEDTFSSVYLFKMEGVSIGLAIIKKRNNTAYLEFFGLHEKHRKKGYARYFLNTILTHSLVKQNLDYVMLVVDQDNIAASSLYQKLGFVIDRVNVSYHLAIKKR